MERSTSTIRIIPSSNPHMNELLDLNKNVYLESDTGEGIFIESGPSKLKLGSLSKTLKTKIGAVRKILDTRIPNGLSYKLRLGDQFEGLSLCFEDGPKVTAYWKLPLNNYDTLSDQLNRVDWNAERLFGMSCCQSVLIEDSGVTDVPARLLPTRRLQTTFHREMKEFITSHQVKDSKVHVLTWQDLGGIMTTTFPTMEAYEWELGNMLPCSYLPIALVLNGSLLSCEEIDKKNHAAYLELRGMPISSAKASGRIYTMTA
jgi:hypothetical protein